DSVEVRVSAHVKSFDVPANNPGENSFSDVDDLLSGMAADRAEADQVGIHMSASVAFDRMRLKMFADDQGLNLSQLKRAKHASQAGHTPPIAARLSQSLLSALAAAIILPLIGDRLGLRANVIPCGVGEVRVKPPDQRLRDIGMQMILEHRYQ